MNMKYVKLLISIKNKKLPNDDLIGFNFNNGIFINEITDLISNFLYEKNININDKKLFIIEI